MTVPLRLCVRRPDATPGRSDGLRLTVDIPSELDIVEEAVDLLARHCVASGVAQDLVRFNVRVALAEALANAMVYGNGLDPEKRVEVHLRVKRDCVELQIRDEGEGFDHRRVPDPTSPERVSHPEGRGLFLIRQLVDELTFNDRGNSLCMILRRA